MVPKFRVWDETQHKMLQVDYIEFIDGKAYWVEASPADGNVQGGNDGPVGGNSQLKLEQSTGLKDANSKEIYEGDIIVSKPNEPAFESPKIGVVKRSKTDARWCYRTATDDYNIWTSGKYRTYEIIGNVHTNPELLEAQHDPRTD
ncbi:YopX family protein [Levilactobacillus brevis]|uniref:YopX family protein n=1 Tax=Levilactobacillus brevis TaxID=1580 RepID=UPI000B35C4DA|nr:YopX family protein [Levilactobacillus brevis]